MESLQEGVVISHLGKGIAVQIQNQVLLCQPRRKLETVAVGDRVMLSRAAEDQGRIEQILPRRSLLCRPQRNNQTRPVAANIDYIGIVFATEPACDFLLIDQYLVLCENLNIDALLIHNKIDLAASPAIESELAEYEALGYPLHRVSATNQIGTQRLADALKDHISIFTGQSGVGKSSLTNLLIPDRQLRTNSVSATTRHGRHTTTAATLYYLPFGGGLIDSPGVAIFGLADIDPSQLAWGYREFQPYIGRCRFHNCRHVHEKDCQVKSAIESGRVSAFRYQRYVKLLNKLAVKTHRTN